MEELFLTTPSMEYAQELMAYRRAFLDSGDSMDGCGPIRRCESAQEYLDATALYTRAETLPEGMVTATQFLCVQKSTGKIVGMIQVRHYLNDVLWRRAGHIGYSVRPDERRKGYAGWMLKSVLPYCRELGLDKVMVCCYRGNEASRRTILKNGGVYFRTVSEPDWPDVIEQYWIAI